LSASDRGVQAAVVTGASEALSFGENIHPSLTSTQNPEAEGWPSAATVGLVEKMLRKKRGTRNPKGGFIGGKLIQR
jgi:hypothetical protein